MFVHEFPEAVCIVGVVWVNVELERVEVSTEKEQALRQFDVLFLEGDGLDLANGVDGVERNCNTQSVASYEGGGGQVDQDWECVQVARCIHIPYSRKFLREKIFTNFTILQPPVLHEILGIPHPLCDQFNLP